VFEITGSIGTRNVKKNSDINSELYDSIELRGTQYRLEGVADYFFPFAQRHVINAGAIGGYLGNSDAFENELFRIGGLKSLRGFNDESIIASSYIIGKLEYRYLMDLNSYLFTFYNLAWYEKNTNTTYVNDTPSGFGAGMAFETKIGIMSLSYALGKEFNNPIQFKTAKIHFGIVNYF
jgi:hemolysin activation/secretion protein